MQSAKIFFVLLNVAHTWVLIFQSGSEPIQLGAYGFRSRISSGWGKYYLFKKLCYSKMPQNFLPTCKLHNTVSTKITFSDFLYKIECFVKTFPKLFNEIYLTRVGFEPTHPKILGPKTSALDRSTILP